MFKNSHLRLLMKLVGIERLAPSLEETPESVWIVPGDLSADQLRESLDLIQQAEFSPPVFEDGELAENQLRRKSAAAPRRKRANFDDDEDGDVNDFLADDEVLFPANEPEASRGGAKGAKKGRGRKRRDIEDGDEEEQDELSAAELKARARARRQRELEKARRIKSELYVHESATVSCSHTSPMGCVCPPPRSGPPTRTP